MKSFAILCAALALAPAVVAGSRHHDSYSETREITLPFLGSLEVENAVGAITVKGWDELYIAVRAEVVGNEDEEYESRVTASLVRIETPSNRIVVTGPRGRSWSANLEISVPRQSGLDLQTQVGAVAIFGITGKIRFMTHVGAVTLAGLAGDVAGETNVGAIAITLAGDRWDGEGLTVRTRTGAVRIAAPAAYSADFDLRTGLGALRCAFPESRGQVTGFLSKKLIFTAGTGGPPIKASTGVGEVELQFAK